jgi:Co/Zn/Cd efflux system component
MGTHALAFGISLTAYMLARRWSKDVSFSFGTWKVEMLGAYTSAVLLSMMAFLSSYRSPVKAHKQGSG